MQKAGKSWCHIAEDPFYKADVASYEVTEFCSKQRGAGVSNRWQISYNNRLLPDSQKLRPKSGLPVMPVRARRYVRKGCDSALKAR